MNSAKVDASCVDFSPTEFTVSHGMRLRPAVCLFAASAALLLSTPVVAFELPGRRLQGLADTQVKRLQNGELHVEAIQETEYEWHWFDLLLNETTWVNMTYSETINYNALIEVDAMSSVTVSGELKWAELDVMIFDGEIRYDEDLVLLCWFNEECPDDAYYARYKGAPRVTNAFGFNRTAVGGLRSPPLTRVVVGGYDVSRWYLQQPSPTSSTSSASTVTSRGPGHFRSASEPFPPGWLDEPPTPPTPAAALHPLTQL